MHAQMFFVLNIQEFAIFCKMYLNVLTFLYKTIIICIYKLLVVCELDKLSVWNFWGSPDASRFTNFFPSNRELSVAKQEIFVCALNSHMWIVLCAFIHFESVLTSRMKLIEVRVGGFPGYIVHTPTYAEWLMEKHHSKGQKEKPKTSLSPQIKI